MFNNFLLYQETQVQQEPRAWKDRLERQVDQKPLATQVHSGTQAYREQLDQWELSLSFSVYLKFFKLCVKLKFSIKHFSHFEQLIFHLGFY